MDLGKHDTKKMILKIFLTGIWITCFEFLRNEVLFKQLWTYHFATLGLKFQTLPVNGILWMVWSFGLAFIIYKLSQKFSFRETLWIAWLSAFPMMWIVAYNLQVLPLGLLMAAVPLSLIEVAVAELIMFKLFKTPDNIIT